MERLKKLDCGDNGCLYAEEKGGMRTNGGCRCHYKVTEWIKDIEYDYGFHSYQMELLLRDFAFIVRKSEKRKWDMNK